VGTPTISTAHSLLTENGLNLTQASTPGDQNTLATAGVRIFMDAGPGLTMAGTGSPANRLAGLHSTMVDGTMTTTMDGSGYQTVLGVQRGSNGDTTTTIWDGPLCLRMRASA